MPDLPSRQVTAADCQLNWEALKQLLPAAGDLKIGAYSTADDGWLLCDGSVYDPVKYPDLYRKIGTAYGGSSSSPLLPDFRGRAPAGAGTGDAHGATAHTLGGKVGKETHKLTGAESGTTAHGHTATSSHGLNGQPYFELGSGTGPRDMPTSGAGRSSYGTLNITTTVAPSSAADAGSEHENRTPSTVVNFFIKT